MTMVIENKHFNPSLMASVCLATSLFIKIKIVKAITRFIIIKCMDTLNVHLGINTHLDDE